VAGEKQGYCLVDLATALKAGGETDLETLVDSADPAWANLYSVLLLCPAKFPALRHDAARRFADFLSAGTGRGLIESFGRAEFGRPVL
jgi:ABC-type tungstate transport system permease subunit